MSQANPFAQAVAQAAPAQPEQQAPPAAPNPFAPQVPQQQAPAPATVGNPYAQHAPAPAAPQAYAPQQQYAPAPQYTQPAAPAAPQWAGQTAQPQQQVAHVPAGPPPALSAAGLNAAPPPPPSGDGKGAKLAHMYGRLVLVFPLAITRRARNPQFITPEQRARGDIEQDMLTATVVVLDDGRGGMTPISFGGDPTAFPPVQDTESAPLPYVRKAMWISQSKLIGQLRDFLPTQGGVPGMICGRVVKAGPQRNDPWYLQGANDQELAHAGHYLAAVANGQYPHPLA